MFLAVILSLITLNHFTLFVRLAVRGKSLHRLLGLSLASVRKQSKTVYNVRYSTLKHYCLKANVPHVFL